MAKSKAFLFPYRFAAAVCHKNLGPSYVNQVSHKLSISPVKSTLKYRMIKEDKIKKKLFANSHAGKSRRKALRIARSSQASNTKRKEGVHFESNIGLSGVLEITSDAPPMTITSSTPKTVACNNNLNEIQNVKIVYIDTKTTGFSLDKDQICQL